MMPNTATTLAEFLAVIVADEAKAVRLIRATPELARARIVDELLLEEIPHQLYVGDTALHAASGIPCANIAS